MPEKPEKVVGVCDAHEMLTGEIRNANTKLDTIIDRLGKGDVTFATVLLRVKGLEKVVYGAVALALIALGTAVLNLVLRRIS